MQKCFNVNIIALFTFITSFTSLQFKLDLGIGMIISVLFFVYLRMSFSP